MDGGDVNKSGLSVSFKEDRFHIPRCKSQLPLKSLSHVVKQ